MSRRWPRQPGASGSVAWSSPTSGARPSGPSIAVSGPRLASWRGTGRCSGSSTAEPQCLAVMPSAHALAWTGGTGVRWPGARDRMATELGRNVTTRTPESVSAEVDSRRLAAELASSVRGEVRFDAGSRALYAKDYSVYRHVPIGVVIPRDVDDVVATVEVCRQYGAPILARGCGTSPNGQCCNVAVVID